MGLFLKVLIVKNGREEDVKSVLEKLAAENVNWNLISEHCQYQTENDGVKVLLNDMCAGFEEMVQQISTKLEKPVMLCYIYDGDYWGYYFYEKGIELDSFVPIPDYFEEVSNRERQRLQGNSKVIAEYFQVEEEKIKQYLQQWSDDILDQENFAYSDDEYCFGEDWQMTDFMKALGFPYVW